jgi:hypothetical protein
MAAAGGGDDLALLPVVASGCVDPSPEVREEALFSLLRLAKRFPDRVVSVVEELAGSSEVSPLVRRRIQALRDGYT